MNPDVKTAERPLWKKILIVLAILLAVTGLAGGKIAYDLYRAQALSCVWVRNLSGRDVYFEKMTIDGKALWTPSDTIVRSPKDLSQPWTDRRLTSLASSFRPPWSKTMKFTLVVLDENRNSETLTCVLDNIRWECSYTVDYYGGRMVCHSCEKMY